MFTIHNVYTLKMLIGFFIRVYVRTFGILGFDYLGKDNYTYFKDIRLVFSVIRNYIAQLLF